MKVIVDAGNGTCDSPELGMTLVWAGRGAEEESDMRWGCHKMSQGARSQRLS